VLALTMLSSLTFAVVFVTLLIRGGSAQSQTNATCLASFGWANNSLGQSPCLVAAYLQGACDSGTFFIPALPNGTHYLGPTLENSNPCQCSTVLYSVVSACAACQGQSYDTWSAWSTNCSNIYPLVFPDNIPSGTAVPGWAYLDVRVGDGFNVAAAERDSNAPESTGTTIPTGTIFSTSTPSSTSSSSATSSSPTASPSPSASAKSSSKSSNAGAIAGGVVGGTVLLGILAAFAFWYRRHGARPSVRPTPATYGAFEASQPSSVGPMSQQRIFSPVPTIPTTTSSRHRHYDSSDPIMPTSPGTTTDMYTTYSAYQGSVADHHTSPDIHVRPEEPEL